MKHLLHNSGLYSISPEEAEANYRAWLHAYERKLERSAGWCNYYVLSEDPVEVKFEPCTFMGPMSHRLGFFRSFCHAWETLSLFPETDAAPESVALQADEDAIMSDWAITGLDLYKTIHGCRIQPTGVRSSTSKPTPATPK